MSQYIDRPEAELIGASPLTAEEVKTYLRQHPELLANDPELIENLLPPSQSTGRNVLDMQHFMIARLQRQVRTLREIQAELIEASSLNSLARDQVHQVTLMLLDTKSFEHLIEFITDGNRSTRPVV